MFRPFLTGIPGHAARVFLLLLALLPALAPAAIKVTDDLGTTLALEAPAERIVSLAPHATELLFAAGAGERVVGVVHHSDHPPAAADLPKVGGYDAIDMERVVALEPDLVIAWHSGNGAETVERLREIGLTVYASEPRRLEDIPKALEAFGRLAGTHETASAAAGAFDERLAALRQRYGERPPIAVFYQIWKGPLMTVNDHHLIGRVIELCGGHNVFGELRPLIPRLSREAVLAADPEVIIASGMGVERPEWLNDWRDWPALRAVHRGNLFHIPPDLIQRHSPRVLDGAEMLCEQLESVRRRTDPAP